MPRHPAPARSATQLASRVFQPLLERARRHPGPLYHLDVGDTWMEPLDAARCEHLLTRDHPLLHAYAPPQGEPALLDAIEVVLAGRGGGQVARDDIQVVSGATAGLSQSCQALLDPGDEVLLPSPYWPLIRGLIASRGAVPVEVPLWTRLDEPGFDLEAELEARVTPRTAALYLNSPHNPTGRILPDAQVAAVARVAERHDLWVLSDDVYEDLWYGAEAPAPPWTREDLRARTVATHSVSKAYGMAGVRVGYTHGPASAMRAVRAVQLHQTYCAPRPMQLAAARALREGDEWLARLRAAYAEAARMTAATLGVPRVEAGAFVFFDVAQRVGPAEDAMPFLERCVDAGVLLVPGAACGAAHRTWARACFTTLAPSALERALDRLRFVMAGGQPAPERPSTDDPDATPVEPGENCC